MLSYAGGSRRRKNNGIVIGFRNAKRTDWSVERLLEKVKRTINGSYHAKNCSDLEFDLAITIYELGGDAALHALHNSPFGFPCRNTLAERRSEHKLRISVGTVRMEDLLYNIEVMFKNLESRGEVGMTLCLDEVACDGRLCWIPATYDIAGLCEHASNLSSYKFGKSLDTEILTAAFARNNSRDYGAKLVLLLPTCKQGTLEDAALILEKLRQAWRMSPYGEAMHGRIWSLASDGDPKRRPALYQHCMVREIQPADSIYQHAGFLIGMNLWTGSNFETQDLDWKHCLKRLCKLLCTWEGILVNGTYVNKTLLATWLEHSTDVDWSEEPLYHLLNPLSTGAQEVAA
ncbi:hypothetical protein EST38_g3755 [Candolleomyces aberdarensis]|uniref:Uncharacterized protein n=1 Tax=Candolleomyces aberdarensis TaxID=2316362 RepID=A0A4Q2DS87_9AGAR|nr:hypothetical protein EST38_g3755 [Candolleomyces aberdarensis]